MRPLFFILCLLVSTQYIIAQNRAPAYIDVVLLKDGDELTGTVIEYVHDKKVVLVLGNGALREIAGDKIRRVNFRLDKYRLKSLEREARLRDKDVDEEGEEDERLSPTRTLQHQVTGSINVGRSSVSQFGNTSTIGGSFAYHLVRKIKFLKVGAGVDVSLMSEARNENVIAATAFAESGIRINGSNIRPIIRFETGPSLPFGSSTSDNEIISRNVSMLIHPSVGVEIVPRKEKWGSLVFDLGYRFLDSRFTVLTASLDELERSVNYRRLVFRGGLRF